MTALIKKHKYLFFLLLVVLFLIPFAVHSRLQKNNVVSRTPTPAPQVSSQTVNVSPVANAQAVESPSPTDADPQNRLLERIQQRQPLSQSDQAVKKKIIAQIPPADQSGNVYHSATINIDYTQPVDLFQVEILTPDVANAKQEAITYFQQNGMSQEGVCNLPLSFYLNFGIKNEVPTYPPFNPLPNGC